jgi:TolA-binding protein
VRASTRRQLKHDKFAETVTGTAADTFSWAAAHQTKVTAGVVALLIVLALAAGGWFYQQQQGEKANIAFGQAMRTYQTQVRPAGTPAIPDVPSFASAGERAQAAQKAFTQVADRYPRTGPGHIARYFVGITLRDQGNYQAAEKQLKDVASSGDKDVAALARYALASMYVAMGRSADAAKEYKELIDHPARSVAKSTAQIELAALYEETKQPAEAAKIYEQIKKDEPKSPAAEFAQSKLAALKPAGQ